ncbi:hypothetical protein [Kitasatospora sp. NPDC048715]
MWGRIEPLLPVRSSGFESSAARRYTTVAVFRILFARHTGIQWERLPREVGLSSGMTCWRGCGHEAWGVGPAAPGAADRAASRWPARPGRGCDRQLALPGYGCPKVHPGRCPDGGAAARSCGLAVRQSRTFDICRLDRSHLPPVPRCSLACTDGLVGTCALSNRPTGKVASPACRPPTRHATHPTSNFRDICRVCPIFRI